MRFAGDSLINAIYQGIKRGIQVTYDNECYGACLILIYCGIDAMSYLDMPPSQEEVHASDFIQWAERYLSPSLKNQATQITGEELYSARCAVVHTYTVESRKTKSGSTRAIGYAVGGGPSIVMGCKSGSESGITAVRSSSGRFLHCYRYIPNRGLRSQTEAANTRN